MVTPLCSSVCPSGCPARGYTHPRSHSSKVHVDFKLSRTTENQVFCFQFSWCICNSGTNRHMKILKIPKESSLNSASKPAFDTKSWPTNFWTSKRRHGTSIYCFQYSIWRHKASLYCLFSSTFLSVCSSMSLYEAIDTKFFGVRYICEGGMWLEM